MSNYGLDPYGVAQYGTVGSTQWSAAPFVAAPSGYGGVLLTWSTPAGEWTALRLLRSRYGFATTETDGDILAESDSPFRSYLDTSGEPGNWYYYTIFVQTADGWTQAGTAASMPVGETGLFDVMWGRIPRYFRWINNQFSATTDSYYAEAVGYNPDAFDSENQHLRNFVQVLAWGADYLRTTQTTLERVNDPYSISLYHLGLLAHELGVEFSPNLPARIARAHVANAASLAQARGTRSGLHEKVSLATGWDVDIEVGDNLMLDLDQAEFASPSVAAYDESTRYATDDLVEQDGLIWQALQVVPAGNVPPATADGTSAFWGPVVGQETTALYDATTNSVSTWKAFDAASGAESTGLREALAVTGPATSTTTSNALLVRNLDVAPHAYRIWGVPSLAGTGEIPDPTQVVQYGIPVANLSLWDAYEDYVTGDQVRYRGATYVALQPSTLTAPTGSVDDPVWEKVGIDERPRLGFSFYAHGPFEGLAGSGGVPVTPGLAYFDEHGQLLRISDTESWNRPVFYDTFNADPELSFDLRTPDRLLSDGDAWRTESGTWSIWEDDTNNVAWPLNGTGVTVTNVPPHVKAYKVAVTFSADTLPGQEQGLVLRYVDSNNWARVGRTSVSLNQAGVLTVVHTYANPITDGARVTVQVNDTNNTATVYIDGVLETTFNLPAAAAPYQHGLMVD